MNRSVNLIALSWPSRFDFNSIPIMSGAASTSARGKNAVRSSVGFLAYKPMYRRRSTNPYGAVGSLLRGVDSVERRKGWVKSLSPRVKRRSGDNFGLLIQRLFTFDTTIYGSSKSYTVLYKTLKMHHAIGETVT